VLSENDIARIAEPIARRFAPLVVGVFGSYAIGTARERSDLDIFVIRDCIEPPAARRRTVRRCLLSVLHPLDIHVFTPSEFEEGVSQYHSFAWVIARQARIHHWSDDAARRVPSLSSASQRVAPAPGRFPWDIVARKAPEAARAGGAIVTFEPGARTNWLTHPLGQTPIVTAGSAGPSASAIQRSKSAPST
jgi:predicted nucleotidyltransferase